MDRMKFRIYGTWHHQNGQLILKILGPLGGDEYNIELYRADDLLFKERLGLFFSRDKHIFTSQIRDCLNFSK